MIGCSHHSTPIEVRERLSFTQEGCLSALSQFRNRFSNAECVLLHTCNRVELYAGFESDQAASPEEMIRFLTEFHGLRSDEMSPFFHKQQDEGAIEHLFCVASSIDSLIVGETQISSQVNDAYQKATDAGFTGPILHSAFQHANLVSKRVTNETEIHRRRISVPSVAVSEIATEFFERLDDKHVLVIGSGEMGVETLQYLRSAGAIKVTVVNRSLERAQQVASQFHVTAAEWDKLETLLLDADLVVSTTGAAHPIMTEARYRALSANRKKGTLLILDLAVPRDFDPLIGRLPGVYLYSVDDLQSVCDRNRTFREQQLPKAKRIIREEVEKFMSEIRLRSSGATIRALRDQAEEIKRNELSRLLGKSTMQNATEEMQSEISQAMDRVINKILHSPLQSIRDVSHSEQRESLVSALRKLFQIR